MNGSERPRSASAWLEMIHDALSGRIRFAGLAYLVSASMVLTLVAGALITSHGSSGSQAAAVAETQTFAVAPPVRSQDDQDEAAELTAVQDLTPSREPQSEATPAPTPAEAEPVVWTARPRRVVAQPAPADGVRAQVAAAPTVQITDSGFVPDQLTVKTGEAIQWTNDGSKVHTATALTGAQRFDTGGLAAHQTAKVAFSAPGTYVYSSATDCLNGNHDPGFTCGKYFAVTVNP